MVAVKKNALQSHCSNQKNKRCWMMAQSGFCVVAMTTECGWSAACQRKARGCYFCLLSRHYSRCNDVGFFFFSSEIGHSGSEKAGLYGTPWRRKHLVAVASPLSCRAYVFLSLLRTWPQVWSTVTPPLRHSCIALFVKFVHMWMCRHELWKWAFEHEVFLTCMWPVHIVLSVRWSFYISMGLLTEKILFS